MPPEKERPEVEAFRKRILNRLLYIFALLGLPAACIGVAQTYAQGRWMYSLIYAGIYICFLLGAVASRKRPYRTRALFFVSSLFLIAFAILMRIGMSGVGLQLMLGVCFMTALFFGMRAAMLVLLVSLAGIISVAFGMITGIIEIYPEQMLTSRSSLAWITGIFVFFMMVGITVSAPEMLRRRLEESLNRLQEQKGELETANQQLQQEILSRRQTEEAFRESEERFSKVFRTSPGPMTISEIETGRFIDANEQTLRMLDFKREELIGRTSHEIGIWDNPEDRTRMRKQLQSTGTFREYPVRFITKTGKPLNVLWSAEIITLGSEKVLLSLFFDITDRKRAEEALRESEMKYKRLAENSPGVVYQFMMAPDGTFSIPYINEALLTVTGISSIDVMDNASVLLGRIHPEDVKMFHEGVMESARALMPYHATFRILKNGHYIWIEARSTPERSPDGSIFWDGFFLDVTERRQERESLLRTQFAMDRTRDSCLWVDDQGRIAYANNAACNSMGYTRDELLVMTVFDIDPDFPREQWEQHKRDMRRHGTMLFEGRHRTKDGRLFPVEVSSNYFEFDGRWFACAYDRDITDRKRAEEENRKLRSHLENIINSMPSLIVGVDVEGNVTQWNVAAEKTTGVGATEALGQPIDRLLPMLSLELEKLRKALGTRTVEKATKLPRTVAGETRYDDVIIYPLVTNGVEGAVIRVDDVTERVRIEEMMIQSEKMVSVGGLAAGMAHEINNPLGVILQASQNVLRRVSPDLPANLRAAEACGTSLQSIRAYLEKREILLFLEDIRQSGHRAAGIVGNMLNFSRKTEGLGGPSDVAELLDRTVSLASSDYDLKKRYDFRQIEIVREYEPVLPKIICQESKIQQVFLNILRNGAEAMSEGNTMNRPPRFTLRIERDNAMVRVEIEDNGPGMDEVTRKRVFEPFFTTKPPGSGTGLGLSISYFIITEDHRGTMRVESSPGNGARFIVELPMKDAAR